MLGVLFVGDDCARAVCAAIERAFLALKAVSITKRDATFFGNVHIDSHTTHLQAAAIDQYAIFIDTYFGGASADVDKADACLFFFLAKRVFCPCHAIKNPRIHLQIILLNKADHLL